MKALNWVVAPGLILALPTTFAATLILTPLPPVPGMDRPVLLTTAIDGSEKPRNAPTHQNAVALRIDSTGGGNVLCDSNVSHTNAQNCRPQLPIPTDCGGRPPQTAFPGYFLTVLNGVVMDIKGTTPRGTGAFYCGWGVMEFTVIMGPPVPDVSCATVGDTLIELSGLAGLALPSARTVVSVSCTGPADFRVSVPHSGGVPITSGDTVYLSFDNGSTSVTYDRSSGANIGLNARVDHPIDYPGVYHGSTAISLDLL